jgi:inosose dehydratase
VAIDVKVGTAPDSWGVWFPSDPKQTPWNRFLDEVVKAGYEWTELGPFGYLPPEPDRLATILRERGLKATTGGIMKHFDDLALWPAIDAEVNLAGPILQQLGAPYLLLIEDTYSNLFTGEPLRPKTLDGDGWKRMIDGLHHVARLARDRYGLQSLFHPHAETHVEYEDQIERFLEDTDPQLIALCFDTGHHAYRGGDPLEFMRRHHARIPYLHIKSVDGKLRNRVNNEHIPFAKAVEMGVFCEPAEGVIDFRAFRDLLDRISYRGWVIVEQDMYPAPLDKPLPIAKRTREYLKEIGIG